MKKSPAHASARHETVVEDADNLLARLSGATLAEDAQALKAKLRETVDLLKASMSDAREQLRTGVAEATDSVTHHPWRAVGMAVGGGFAIGLLAHVFWPRNGK